MIIRNQDKDETFNLKPYFGKVYTDEQSINGVLYGYNVIGKKYFGVKKVLLGTYDTMEDAEQVAKEIYRLLDSGSTYYSMPEVSDIEDLLIGTGIRV